MSDYTFDDLKKIKRDSLGDFVPLELYRSVRLIGMYQGLPLKGKNTTLTVGAEIGRNLPVTTIEELFSLFENLKIGIPEIIEKNDHAIHIAIKDCFCAGLPIKEGHMVCDLEGAILAGALAKVYNQKVYVREVKCNVNGDDHCEYLIRLS